MDGKTLVVLEGQQHWIDSAIANDDNLLRQLFSTLSPELAGAEIKRTESQINLVPRKGTKGNRALEILDSAEIELNPAAECSIALQRLELSVGIDPQRSGSIATEIDAALEQAKQWDQSIKNTLNQLDRAKPCSLVPMGF